MLHLFRTVYHMLKNLSTQKTQKNNNFIYTYTIKLFKTDKNAKKFENTADNIKNSLNFEICCAIINKVNYIFI